MTCRALARSSATSPGLLMKMQSVVINLARVLAYPNGEVSTIIECYTKINAFRGHRGEAPITGTLQM
jgi:hypothetical protein